MSSKSNILKEQPNISKELLGYTITELSENGGSYTAREIDQQPVLWKKIWKLVHEKKEEINTFLEQAFSEESISILLTGAGTSAYLGNVLQGPFQKNSGKITTAIATTDLIVHPQHYFNKKATLMISFARSGDSPESLAAINIANAYSSTVYHLIITCNPNGQLVISSKIGDKKTLLILLPEEADDKGLAMTSSFTSMLLTGILISRIKEIELLKAHVDIISLYAKNILENYSGQIFNIAKLDFQRAIFLGSGPMRAVAKESDLKVQELTDGKVICKSDSFLGFRHGPKAVINPSTLLVYLFSNNKHAHLYETDLVQAIGKGERGLLRIGVIEKNNGDNLAVDILIELSQNGESVDEEFLSVVSVLPAQLLGFYKSIDLGLSPDKPSKQETITRVVRGVTIYSLPH